MYIKNKSFSAKICRTNLNISIFFLFSQHNCQAFARSHRAARWKNETSFVHNVLRLFWAHQYHQKVQNMTLCFLSCTGLLRVLVWSKICLWSLQMALYKDIFIPRSNSNKIYFHAVTNSAWTSLCTKSWSTASWQTCWTIFKTTLSAISDTNFTGFMWATQAGTKFIWN